MPITKDFYQGTPGKDMAFDETIHAYVGYTMAGERVEVNREAFEKDARNYFNTNLAWWWILNRPDVTKVSQEGE